jgi:hypothetical protein
VVSRQLVAICLMALGGAACSGGEESAPVESAAPTTEAMTTEATTTEATTTEPTVEPLNADERAWLKDVEKVGRRIDDAFLRNLTFTQGTVERLIRVLETCTPTMREAGPASVRFAPAEELVQRACDQYDTAAETFEIVLSVSAPGGGVVVGTPEEKIYNRAFDRAFTAQSKGSDLMTRANAKADQIRAQIEAESGG